VARETPKSSAAARALDWPDSMRAMIDFSCERVSDLRVELIGEWRASKGGMWR
jgi:hypothetical protein